MTSQLGGGGGYPEQSGFTGVAERVGLREAGEEAGAEAGRRKLRQAARTQAVWRKLRRVLAEVSATTKHGQARLTIGVR